METALVVAEQPALPVLLEAELELGSDFARASKAKATQAAYASDFRIFEAWCHERGLSALPAAPATVCAFLAAQAGLGKRASTLGRHLDLRQPRHRRQGDATRSAPHAWHANYRLRVRPGCDEPNSEPQRRWHRFGLRAAPLFREKPEDHGGSSCGYYGARRGWAD
jgi:hypothetical protein